MDMIFASDGSLCLLECGQKWNQRNRDARLNHITDDAECAFSVIPVSGKKPREQIDKPEGQPPGEASDCRACHNIEALVNGPGYKQIVERHVIAGRDYLAEKIIEGGAGAWGERHMPTYPQPSPGDAEQMVGRILSLDPANQLREHVDRSLLWKAYKNQ